jgi:L-serine kinase (ADP)
MNKQIQLVPNRLLKQHEQIRKRHMRMLLKQIKIDGYLDNPLIVDKKTMIILDGHHRYNALKSLGMASSPVYLCQL